MDWTRLSKSVRAKVGWIITALGFIKWAADWWGRFSAVRDWASYLPRVLRFVAEPWVTPPAIVVGLGCVVWAALDRAGTTGFDNARWLPARYRQKRIPHEYIVGSVLVLFLIVFGFLMHRRSFKYVIPLNETVSTTDRAVSPKLPSQQKPSLALPPPSAYLKTPSPPPRRQTRPTYSIGIAPGSIINQGSPNYGNQTVNNIDTSRRLNQQQIAAIKSSAQSICAAFPMIKVTASNGNQEAQRYAYDFIEALRGGGCKADLALPIPGLTPDVSGIHIAVRDFSNIDASAKALGKILSDAGLPFLINPMKPDFFPDEAFVLVIGVKE